MTPPMSRLRWAVGGVAACVVFFAVSALVIRAVSRDSVRTVDCAVCQQQQQQPRDEGCPVVVQQLSPTTDDDAVADGNNPAGPRRRWAYLEFHSLFYNLGHPLSTHYCATKPAGADEQCRALQPVLTSATRELVSHGTVYVDFPETYECHGTTGFYALILLGGMLCDVGINAFVNAGTDCWSSTWFKDTPDAMPAPPRWPGVESGGDLYAGWNQSHTESGLIVIPERQTPRRSDTRAVKWLLGWHQPLERSGVRVLGHTHHSLKIMGGLSPTIVHIPPFDFMVAAADKAIEAGMKKENIVVVDNDAHVDLKWLEGRLRTRVPDAVVQEFKGLSRDEVMDLFMRAKATVDSCMPGGESINYEGPLFQAVTIIGNDRVGEDGLDFAEMRSHRYPADDRERLAELVADVLEDYPQHAEQQREWQQRIRNDKPRMRRDTEISFFSRGLLVYTSVSSLAELYALTPFMLAVGALYPFARVEILMTEAMAGRWETDFEVLHLALKAYGHNVFEKQYARLTVVKTTVGPGDVFFVRPASRGQLLTMFADVRTLPIGRDALNAHAHALFADNLVCAGDPETSPFVVVRDGEYWEAVQGGAATGRAFADAAGDVRAKLGGDEARVVPPDVLAGLPTDAVSINAPRYGAGHVLHLTHTWHMGIDTVLRGRGTSDAAMRQLLVEALDPIAHGPLWAVMGSFFPAEYQWLSILSPRDYGMTSVMEW